MTGTTLAKYVAQVKALGGITTGPPTVNDVAAAAPDTPAASSVAAPAGAAGFGVPYNLQSGLTRYAPMQPVPPTKITANNPKPLFPTSPFVIATAALPPATILTTLTATPTFSVHSMQNTVCIASNS